jgi:hypothetical protein
MKTLNPGTFDPRCSRDSSQRRDTPTLDTSRVRLTSVSMASLQVSEREIDVVGTEGGAVDSDGLHD